MHRSTIAWALSTIGTLLASPALPAQQVPAAGALDRGKRIIERPVKVLAALEAAPAEPLSEPPAAERPAAAERPQPAGPDYRKMVIQAPVKQAIAGAAAAGESSAALVDEEALAAPDDNPAVAPGLVRWHADFAAACKAAQVSGKPVLLFQLLGQLDQRFT